MPVIVYDNKNLHITELEDTQLVFILYLFYLSVVKYNDTAVKIDLVRLGETYNHFSLAQTLSQCCIEYTSTKGFELALVLIGIGSCKSNYHAIMTTMASSCY